jgi:hypothetical protein
LPIARTVALVSCFAFVTSRTGAVDAAAACVERARRSMEAATERRQS